MLDVLAQEIADGLLALARDDTPQGRERLAALLLSAARAIEPRSFGLRPPHAAALDGVADGFRAIAEHVDFLSDRAALTTRAPL